jgi:hypothetical protein
MMELAEVENKEETFWQKLTLPEEDRDRTMPRVGGYRWFRSANVIPIERYRRRREVEGLGSPM